jgi:ribosomal protein S18 acetylase RimI-like enzyme
MAASDSSGLLVALDPSPSGEDAVVGTLTLVLFRIPTGLRAWIKDVIVDERVRGRGRGTGAALSRYAIELAQREGARTVELTSRPAREAANRLYRRLGFRKRDTTVYRHEGDGG